MALTELQSEIMRCLAANRSETSYAAGGLVLNTDWPRQSDDIDIFHDTDEEIGAAAHADIAVLRDKGFDVHIDVDVYGVVEATVSRDRRSTVIQWMSESKRRFFPIVRDTEWGARLHRSDLAVNKVLAASSRSKARDFVDLVSIARYMSPLGPIVLAAAGKPPHFSPQKILDEIRRRGLSVPNEEYAAVKGIPDDWSPETIRDALQEALDHAETYVRQSPPGLVGLLAVDVQGTPVEVSSMKLVSGIQLRKPTDEGDIMPSLDITLNWRPPTP